MSAQPERVVGGLVPIHEVARLAGVTSRTLRHYDAVGLLSPAAVAANGVRWYGDPELLRLQEILLLRATGLGLRDIAAVLAGETDRVAALRTHRQRLVAEAEALAALVVTVDRTIAGLEEGREMAPEELFEGFDGVDPQTQARHERELEERYGPAVREHIDQSHRRVAAMTPQDKAAVGQDLEVLESRMAALLAAGHGPGDAEVQAVVADHYAWVCRFWTPDADAFAGLGDLYVDHPEFRAHYEDRAPGLAEFYRDAMTDYALRTLTP
ncbi:MAG: TipAS antibiotic-recognition domain-containing protein [Candidatus Nanopelagicales bacterium]